MGNQKSRKGFKSDVLFMACWLPSSIHPFPATARSRSGYSRFPFLIHHPGFQIDPPPKLTNEADESSTGLASFMTVALRRGGEGSAKAIVADIAQMPITLVPIESLNLELVRQASIFKATKKLSYADCFAAALAKIRKAELVTGDKGFAALERDIKIAWLEAARA